MNGNEAADVMFMGVKISNVDYRRTYDTLSRIVVGGGKGYVCLNDVGNVIEATRDDELKMAINEATFSLADGMPLARFAQLVGCTGIERITGFHLMKRMLSEKDGFRHYLLGDTDETIASVIAEARKLNGEIKISGYSPPFKAFEEEDNRRILDEVRKEDPDVIWVSFGGVRQEKWMHQQIRSLERGVMIGAGAAFRWLIGDIPVPPQLVQTMGLQWVYRFMHEFMKNPLQARNFCKKRKFMRNRIYFLANLPLQVSAARKELKGKPGNT